MDVLKTADTTQADTRHDNQMTYRQHTLVQAPVIDTWLVVKERLNRTSYLQDAA